MLNTLHLKELKVSLTQIRNDIIFKNLIFCHFLIVALIIVKLSDGYFLLRTFTIKRTGSLFLLDLHSFLSD